MLEASVPHWFRLLRRHPVRVSNRAGGKKVHGHRLTREYQIDLPQTVRFYDARIDEDGVLVLDLRTARISPRSAGHHRNRDKDQKRSEDCANGNIAM